MGLFLCSAFLTDDKESDAKADLPELYKHDSFLSRVGTHPRALPGLILKAACVGLGLLDPGCNPHPVTSYSQEFAAPQWLLWQEQQRPHCSRCSSNLLSEPHHLSLLDGNSNHCLWAG